MVTDTATESRPASMPTFAAGLLLLVLPICMTTPTALADFPAMATMVLWACCLGAFLIGRKADIAVALPCLFAAVLVNVLSALEQCFGGFDAIAAQGPEYVRATGNRYIGEFSHPNSLGGFMALALPLFLFGNERWLKIAGVSACVLGLALSGSKGAWLAVLAAVAVVGFRRVEWRRWIMAGVATGFVLLAINVAYRGLSGSGSARLELWSAAASIMADAPLTGVGPGQFQFALPSYLSADAEFAKCAHNNYLQVGAELGVVGLTAYLIACAWILKRGFSRAGNLACACAFLAFAVHGLFDFDLYVPALAVSAFLFAGGSTT